MGEGPKLYVHKPKKAKMKQVKGIDVQSSSKPSSSTTKLPSSSAISSYYSTGSTINGGGGSGGVSKPPEIPKESFAKRYKYLWPMLLTVNLGIGAYLFMRTKKDGAIKEESTNVAIASAPTPTTTPLTSITPPAATVVTQNLPVAQPIRVLEPIPEMQQRELFKWMLEEKRKIKTNDLVENKHLDEEKAILKHFIQAKSIPNF